MGALLAECEDSAVRSGEPDNSVQCMYGDSGLKAASVPFDATRLGIPAVAANLALERFVDAPLMGQFLAPPSSGVEPAQAEKR